MAVSSLLLRAHLAKRLARLGNDLASALTLEEIRRLARHGQSDRAHETREPRPRMTLQPIQQRLRALLLRRPYAGRVNAREALQHVDLNAGVVADRRQAERFPRSLGLHLGILRVGRPHLSNARIDSDQP